jgi:hypothetical protein
MQTRDSRKQLEEGKRDLELENIVGNLLIAEYQVDRLRTRLGSLIDGYRSYRSLIGDNKMSTHIFKHNNKWYKILLRIQETDPASAKETGQNQFTGYSS